MQIAKDIFSILEDLWDIIQGNIENQAHYIQVLLADEFDKYKGKENQLVEKHIKTIQNAYQKTYKSTPQPMIVDKKKQKEDKVQDKEVLLYKHYDILSKSSKLKISEPIFVQDKINNLEKAMKTLQAPVKTVPFYPPPYYKTLQFNGEQSKQY